MEWNLKRGDHITILSEGKTLLCVSRTLSSVQESCSWGCRYFNVSSLALLLLVLDQLSYLCASHLFLKTVALCSQGTQWILLWCYDFGVIFFFKLCNSTMLALCWESMMENTASKHLCCCMKCKKRGGKSSFFAFFSQPFSSDSSSFTCCYAPPPLSSMCTGLFTLTICGHNLLAV